MEFFGQYIYTGCTQGLVDLAKVNSVQIILVENDAADIAKNVCYHVHSSLFLRAV